MQFITYNYMGNWIPTWFAFLKISTGGESEEEWEILMMTFLPKPYLGKEQQSYVFA